MCAEKNSQEMFTLTFNLDVSIPFQNKFWNNFHSGNKTDYSSSASHLGELRFYLLKSNSLSLSRLNIYIYYKINTARFCPFNCTAVNKAALTGLKFDNETLTHPERKL